MKPKKGILVVLCGVLMLTHASVIVYAQNIWITTPYPFLSSPWCKGNTHKITWTKSGDMDEQVKIRLLDKTGSNVILRIVDVTPNNGSFHWTVPTSLPDGEYRIRVRTVDNKVLADSAVFSISECPEPTKIEIISPKGKTYWDHDGTYTITWISTGKTDDQVIISLYRSDVANVKVTDISHPIPNDGSYTWPVHPMAPLGSYRVRVQTVNNLVWGEGGPVIIRKKEPPAPDPPDLVVCLNIPGKTSVINRDKRVNFIAINRGKGEAPASILEIYVTNFGTSRQPIPALKPGEEYVWSRNFKWKTRGEKTIRAIIDPDNLVAESNEKNNMVQIKERVRVTESYYRLEGRTCSDDPRSRR